MTRTEIALRIFQGMCAGDWNMPIPEGQTWDDVAIPRAFDLAEKIMRYNALGIVNAEQSND